MKIISGKQGCLDDDDNHQILECLESDFNHQGNNNGLEVMIRVKTRELF